MQIEPPEKALVRSRGMEKNRSCLFLHTGRLYLGYASLRAISKILAFSKLLLPKTSTAACKSVAFSGLSYSLFQPILSAVHNYMT
jgi:hypothetical protein